MQVNVAGLRRNIKNIAHNYTEPQKKVREATSNDPWCASGTLMSEIADLTYNIEAFSQIMEMLWKRLNDHGKNWRHVYKSLVLLEYLIKTGSERVGQQCKENIFAIQTLKDFQYFEDNKDQGLNVREKAKQLVTLLGSEERIRNERARALKARERFAQTISGFGSSDSNDTTPTSPVFSSQQFAGSGDTNGHSYRQRFNPDLENARPQTIGEEELQLQLALAMSKEEAEQEDKRKRSDELRLQMAISQSEQEIKARGGDTSRSVLQHHQPSTSSVNSGKKESAIMDLLDLDIGGAVALPPHPQQHQHQIQGASALVDPWSPSSNPTQHSKVNDDPWSKNDLNIESSPIDGAWSNNSVVNHQNRDPWAKEPEVEMVDPWAPKGAIGGTNNTNNYPRLEDDEFESISKRNPTSSSPLFDLNSLGNTLMPMSTSPIDNNKKKKDPSQFLGENSNLVNLDNLLPSNNTFPMTSSINSNTSLLTTGIPSTNLMANPFQTAQGAILKPSINELREQQMGLGLSGLGQISQQQQQQQQQQAGRNNNPWSPVKSENPYFG